MEEKVCKFKPCVNYGNVVKNEKCVICFSTPLPR